MSIDPSANEIKAAQRIIINSALTSYFKLKEQALETGFNPRVLEALRVEISCIDMLFDTNIVGDLLDK